MKTAIVAALAISVAVASLSSAQTPVDTSCKPTIEPAQYSRGVPWTYVDQGLESIPLLHPRHQLLAQRRSSQLGDVTFSLLVYKEDATKPDVTIGGMAVEGPPSDLRAWRFRARCPVENITEGLVTIFEEIAKLSKSR
jgi:hypothetical protein